MNNGIIGRDRQRVNGNKDCNGTKTLGDAYLADTVANMALSSSVITYKSNQTAYIKPRSNGVHQNGLTDKTADPRDTRLVFNICGEKYEVLQSTVQRYPNTLLGDPKKRETFWDEGYQEYFLDRNRACFESVLTYYQSNGILIKPQSIPDVLFFRELKFYELGDEVLKKVKEKGEPESVVETENPTPEWKFQRQVWNLFEYPETSNAARCVAWLSCAVVLVSIVLFCVETLPQFRDNSQESESHQIFFIIEAICISWFTFEYITRLVSSPNKWKFVKEPLNIIDLVAILPFFVAFAISDKGSDVSSVAILRAVRLVRVFRIFKLSRYSTGLRILGMTLRASIGELGLLVFFLSVGVVLFGSAIYYAEMNVKGGKFRSIPHSFWWAIVTMTTVGYGDMYPETLGGKLIGCVCACTGILAIALPVPVIVANFERFYSQSQQEAKKNSQEKHKKAAKYKALKRFFDKIRQRNNNGGEIAEEEEEEYYDMGAPVSDEMNANSDGTYYDPLVIPKNGPVICTSSV